MPITLMMYHIPTKTLVLLACNICICIGSYSRSCMCVLVTHFNSLLVSNSRIVFSFIYLPCIWWNIACMNGVQIKISENVQFHCDDFIFIKTYTVIRAFQWANQQPDHNSINNEITLVIHFLLSPQWILSFNTFNTFNTFHRFYVISIVWI